MFCTLIISMSISCFLILYYSYIICHQVRSADFEASWEFITISKENITIFKWKNDLWLVILVRKEKKNTKELASGIPRMGLQWFLFESEN